MVSSKSWRYSLLALAGLVLPGLVVASMDDRNALHLAVYEERVAEAKALLAKGADARAANRYGVTPLSLACANGNAELVTALLDAGADANREGNGSEIPLMIAARTGTGAVVEKLLTAGAKVNASDRKGQTALMWAAVEGHAEAVKILLAAGADHTAKLKSGFNPWFFAARQGHRAVLEILLADGADVNAAMVNRGGGGRAPRKGTSALILAVENGHFELAARLLEAGADANDMRSGYSPLHVLTWVRKPRRGDGIDGAPPPRGSGDVTSLEFAELLVKNGAKADAKLGRNIRGGDGVGRAGATPFLLASRTADLPLMKFLIEHGADPRRPNDHGRTPLLAAAGVMLGPEADEAASEDEAILAVNYLLELGANINITDKNGDTVMHAAACKQSPRLVRLLAQEGADIKVWNQMNKQGRTPLLIAQGFRNGNFKPSDLTIAALSEVMRSAGVKPPEAPPRPVVGKKENYRK